MSINDRVLNERLNEWIAHFEKQEEEEARKLKEKASRKNNKKQV